MYTGLTQTLTLTHNHRSTTTTTTTNPIVIATMLKSYPDFINDKLHVLRQVEIRDFKQQWIAEERVTTCTVQLYSTHRHTCNKLDSSVATCTVQLYSTHRHTCNKLDSSVATCTVQLYLTHKHTRNKLAKHCRIQSDSPQQSLHNSTTSKTVWHNFLWWLTLAVPRPPIGRGGRPVRESLALTPRFS